MGYKKKTKTNTAVYIYGCIYKIKTTKNMIPLLLLLFVLLIPFCNNNNDVNARIITEMSKSVQEDNILNVSAYCPTNSESCMELANMFGIERRTVPAHQFFNHDKALVIPEDHIERLKRHP